MLGGCDLPTEGLAEGLPWETRWAIPLASAEIGLASFLPAGVTITEDRSAFRFELAGLSFTRSLGEVCGGGCGSLDGYTVPKPAFSEAFQLAFPLPAGLVSAQLAGGTVQVEIHNGFSFDPLRPGGSEYGVIILSAIGQSGDTVLYHRLDGSEVALTPGSTLRFGLALAPVRVQAPLTVSVQVDSPKGDRMRIDTKQSLSVKVLPATLLVRDAEVALAAQAISIDAMELELDGIDTEGLTRLSGGALLLQSTNPLGVEGDLTLGLVTPDTTVHKSFQLAAGPSLARIEFTADELERVLAAPRVTLSVAGQVGSGAGAVRVRPDHRLIFDGMLEVALAGTKEGLR